MTCPICGKPTVQTVRPFCSKRCADVDLARWFRGAYAIPSHNHDDAEALEEELGRVRQDPGHQKPH
jgi:hypothetical protein